MAGRWRVLAVAAAGLVACQVAAGAEVKLPSVFGDNMVLQRGIVDPVWGTAQPGEKVTVRFRGRTATATAGADGAWSVKVGPFAAGGPYDLTVAGASDTVTLRNVLVGDVWVCSGQSNMQMAVGGVRNAQQEIAAADYPSIRLFIVPNVVAETPQRDVRATWAPCSPSNVGGSSAVAYFFARELYNKYKVPIGLLETSWGGTPAESWTSHEALAADPDLAGMLSRIPRAGADGKPAKAWDSWTPSGLYNSMISPLVPFGIKGAIWYQGESNAGRAYQYRKLFPAMIRDWRKAWGQGDFPFFWVQLANFTPRNAQPVESDWAELREAQTMTLALPKTGMAVIIDIGEGADIHPKNKQDVGKRLAVAAENVAYGDKGVEASGPLYQAMSVRDGKVTLAFSHVGGGLAAGGDRPLTGFAVAGEDRKFVWANARIEGDRVVVWSDEVKQPVAVRYAWSNNPDCNLYNKAGLPASPFRTDTWPGVTVNNK